MGYVNLMSRTQRAGRWAPRDWGAGGERKDVLPKDTKFELGKRNNFKNSII